MKLHPGWREQGAEGGRSALNSMSHPSAFECLKIAMQCQHFHNLVVISLESVVKFYANLKGVVCENIARFIRLVSVS